MSIVCLYSINLHSHASFGGLHHSSGIAGAHLLCMLHRPPLQKQAHKLVQRDTQQLCGVMRKRPCWRYGKNALVVWWGKGNAGGEKHKIIQEPGGDSR